VLLLITCAARKQSSLYHGRKKKCAGKPHF
jgi:hypothetical protein